MQGLVHADTELDAGVAEEGGGGAQEVGVYATVLGTGRWGRLVWKVWWGDLEGRKKGRGMEGKDMEGGRGDTQGGRTWERRDDQERLRG